jgi:DNA-binding NarL/FixJ family response regulator
MVAGTSRRRHLSVEEGVVMANVRVLVVEDFEPFRRFLRSALGLRSILHLVGGASDGLEAVRKAEELQPDLILLDIGWPTMNGIEAARRIRTLSPQSRIIFVTQEYDPAIVEGALNLGAWGYVVKIQAATDLPAAVDAVLDGRQFVSGGLTGPDLTPAQTAISY